MRRSLRSTRTALSALCVTLAAACLGPCDGGASAPGLTAVSPARGPERGGLRVVVSGSTLSSVSQVLFGDVRGEIIDASDPSALVVATPPHAAGPVDVRVVADGGEATLRGAFTFDAPSRPGCRSLSHTRPAGCPAEPVAFRFDPSSVGRAGAQKVLLAGEFTYWQGEAIEMRREGSDFVAQVPLVPGDYDYKFIVDGTWFADPGAASEPIFGNSVKRVADACLPSVEIREPRLGEFVELGSVSIAATARAGQGGAPRTIDEVVLCVDDREHEASVAADGRIAASVALPDGPHRLAMQVKDSAGFVSRVAWTRFTIDTVDEKPVANAGPTQFVRVGQTFLLDGAGSYDPDGRGLTSWTWRTVTAPASVDAAKLPDARASSAEGYRKDGVNDDPDALAPTTPARKSYKPTIAGTYTFELMVADANGPALAPSRTQVVVLPSIGPRPRATVDVKVADGKVTIDASGSQRPDRAVFRWLGDAANPGALDVTPLVSSDGAKLTVDSRRLSEGAWRFWVWIEADGGASWPAAAQVTVRGASVEAADFLLAPSWSYDKNIYEIFVRRFNDSDGDGVGDLDGVTAKLDYLKGLGVETLWLMPVFVSNDHAHGYHTLDYYDVDPELGTREDLLALVGEAHARGMKLVLDLVVNHTSRKHPFFRASIDGFRDGASAGPSAWFRDWFLWFDNGKADLLSRFGYGRELGGERLGLATGWAEIPDVNFAHPEARRYFFELSKYWLDPNGDGEFSDGIDGWRLDHVTGPEHVVWNALRSELKAVNPDVLLIAEIFRDFDNGGRGYGIKDYYRGEVDAAFTFPLYWDFEGIFASDADPRRLRETVTQLESDRFPTGALHASFLENHDVPTGTTAFERYGEAKMRAALSLQVMLPPVPQALWGQELGLEDYRGWAPWSKEGPENTLEKHFRSVMTLRRDRLALRRGSFEWVANSRDHQVVSAARKAGDETVVALVNASHSAGDVTISLDTHATGGELVPLAGDVAATVTIAQGRATVSLPAWGSAFFEVRRSP